MVSKSGTLLSLQDEAPCYTARPVEAFLAELNILLLDWHGKSLEMNPIENLWQLMKTEVTIDVINNKTQLLEKMESSTSNAGDSTVLHS